MCLVSFLVPVKNEQSYICDAIDSLLAITTIEYEVLFVDDGSTDDTVALIESYDDPRIKCFLGGGKGKVAALNLAYEQSSGQFFILFAGDDILCPDVVVDRIAPFAAVDMAAISLCKVRMFSLDERYNNIIIPKSPGRGASTGGGMAFNKKFADCIFPIPDGLPNEDTWIKAFVDFGFCKVFHVPLVGLNYRIHSGNSIRRDVDFHKFSNQLHVRERANKLFEERHAFGLSLRSRRLLRQRCSAQDDRYHGRWIKIFFYFSLPLKERVSLIFYSNSVFYYFRQRFYSFFSGR
ncbi:glycosyltransferase family A protein [Pseudomonas sp. G34]|uniref:glycosyltransferase family 2 protein n=1 Tax=Pseudomonas sp. G34 TaxID=3059083 RepID=UPI002809FF31|nr:glycosyltransferase family A protein [Pseudomonas sp. G34]MDQ7985751.1 glycosyltransferase family A protein [Pseudomonas sp. G34]